MRAILELNEHQQETTNVKTLTNVSYVKDLVKYSCGKLGETDSSHSSVFKSVLRDWSL